ncbi:hypothetical protein FI667_g2536, partial [Globisporangium splendens]
MEENGAAQQEKKRKRSCRILSADTAKAINDVRSFFEKEAKAKKAHKLMAPVERTAACFDVSTRSVLRVRDRLGDGDEYPDIDERARDMNVPDEFIPIVRQVIMDMYTAKEHVTLNTLLAKLQDQSITTRSTTWKWSRATLHRFLTAKMRYSYGQRRSHYDNLKEDVFVAAQRVRYIKRMREFRDQGRPIFYQDETWVNRNMSPTLVCLDEEDKGGIKVPSGKGERSIVCHIGGETGFVHGAELVFRGKKSLKDSDYHTEMNANVFLDWMEKKVLPNVPRGSVLVLDRATYHTTLTPESRPARSDFRKTEFAEWLAQKNVQYNGFSTAADFMTLTRVELLSLCKQNKPRPIYEVSILAQRFECEIILLPVAHPELNPIEMVWSGLKWFVARNNRDFSLAKVAELTRTYLRSFNQSQWVKNVAHCIEVENKYLLVADDIPVE